VHVGTLDAVEQLFKFIAPLVEEGAADDEPDDEVRAALGGASCLQSGDWVAVHRIWLVARTLLQRLPFRPSLITSPATPSMQPV